VLAQDVVNGPGSEFEQAVNLFVNIQKASVNYLIYFLKVNLHLLLMYVF